MAPPQPPDRRRGGDSGIWALEHHPGEFLYGYSLAAELRPETRYDEVVSALGCHGELVRSPDELRPALDRAFASEVTRWSTCSPTRKWSTRAGRTWRSSPPLLLCL